MFARTALSAAVTVALVSAPATLGVPVFGSVSDSGSNAPVTSKSSPFPTATETHEPSESPQPTQSPDEDDSPDSDPEEDETHDPKDEESTLPEGTFEVRMAAYGDTFALFDPRGDLFESDDTDFEHSDIEITLPNIQGEDRDFVLTEDRAALDIIDGSGSEPYSPGVNDEGHREFIFKVNGQGKMTEPTDKRPESTPEPTDEPTDEPSDDPTEPGPTPTPAPTPTGTPDPPPEPTDDPDDGDDREDEGNDGSGDDEGSDDEDPGDDGSGSDERDDEGLTEDPSTGNGSDDGGRDEPREAAPSGNDDWVPTGPQRPDYSDPVPQPPGAGEDDAITPDDEASTQPADGEDGDDGSDDVATDSASEDGNGAGMPWQIGVVVAIGAAAIGFILFVAGRRRKD